jgi:hypothetical protein
MSSAIGLYSDESANRNKGIFGWAIAHEADTRRDARRFPSTRWYPLPEATRTTLGFGIHPSFKVHISVAPCQTLIVTTRNFSSLYATRREPLLNPLPSGSNKWIGK